MSAPRILLVEDQQQVRDLIRVVLETEGMQFTGAPDGPTGLRLVKESLPDLVLLDHRLGPEMNGLEVCRRLRADPSTSHLPIIVLTAEVGPEIEQEFFEAGADDYVRKGQFRSAVFLGRVRAVLRRTRAAGADVVRSEHLVLHPARREARADGRLLSLTPTEFDILYKLVANSDRVLTRRELLDRGDRDVEAVDRTVDVHVLSVRRKLGDLSWLVATVWGRGYRLGTAPSEAEPRS